MPALFGAGFVLFKSSYLLQFVVPLIAAIPIAMHRLVYQVRAFRSRPALANALLVLLGAGLLSVWPGSDADMVRPLLRPEADSRRAELIQIREQLFSPGRTFDCSGLLLRALWAPPSEVLERDYPQAPVRGLGCVLSAQDATGSDPSAEGEGGGVEPRQEAGGDQADFQVITWEHEDLTRRLQKQGWVLEKQLFIIAGSAPLLLWTFAGEDRG